MRQTSTTPIAMGELFNNPAEWLPLIEGRLIDFLRMHISQMGGITPARNVAAMAAMYGIRTAWHGPGDVSPVGHAANLHLDLWAPNFGVQEWCRFGDLVYEIFPGTPEVRGGYMYPNDRPGLGVEVNEELAARYPCQDEIIRLDPGSDARRRARPAVTFISGYSLSEDYAGHLQRIGAFAIDLAILTAAGAVMALAAELLDAGSDPVTIPLLSAFQLLMPWFYYAVMESSSKGATIGKMILGIRVADAEGHIRPLSAAPRSGPFPSAFPSSGRATSPSVFTQRRQAFHDLIARTLVLKSSN